MLVRIAIYCIISVCSLPLFSQEDSVKTILPHKLEADTLEPAPTQRNPKRATLLSAVLPGSGQIYNRKYWKLPIVYGALGTAGYFFFDNRSRYLPFKEAYVIDADTTDGLISEYYGDASLDQLRGAADQYRKWMEYSAIVFTIFYALQIVDATVDAHLFYFNVSDDLSMRIEPMYQTHRIAGPIPGAGLTLTF